MLSFWAARAEAERRSRSRLMRGAENKESHNLEISSAQDYDVASYNKLHPVDNNSPRNDMYIVIASESEAIQPIVINNKTKKEDKWTVTKIMSLRGKIMDK